MNEPKLTIVVGANGAGKTTWTREHRKELPERFYNADSIADGLGSANDPSLQREARRLVDEQIERDLAQRREFGFESTYSGRSRPNIVRKAKQAGYRTSAVFIGTENSGINIERVRIRVEEGGHHVDENEVKRRWHAAWRNLINTWDDFDTIMVLDNSGRKPIQIGGKLGQSVWKAGTAPEWVRAMPQGTTEDGRAEQARGIHTLRTKHADAEARVLAAARAPPAGEKLGTRPFGTRARGGAARPSPARKRKAPKPDLGRGC